MRHNLTACTTNLLGYLRNDNPNASVRNVLGALGQVHGPVV